jgi:hypothetical protein
VAVIAPADRVDGCTGAAVAWLDNRAVVAANPAVARIAAVRRAEGNFTVSLLRMRTRSGRVRP